MIQMHAQIYGIYRVISITTYVHPVLLLQLYFKKDDKSTSDSLRLDSATVLDDTTDSGKPLKQLIHLLKSHLQIVGYEYDKTAVSYMYSHFLILLTVHRNDVVGWDDNPAGLPWVWGFPWGFPWVWVWVWDGYGD